MKKLFIELLVGIIIVLSGSFAWNPAFVEGKEWINLSRECTQWVWQWCFSFDEIIHWKGSSITEVNKDRTVLTIAQDIILAATYAVWTVLTIAIIYCGLMHIFASRDGKDVNQYRKWLINAAIWAILVRWAYAIVRLIQYIAKW